jgi:LppM domain
MKYRLLKMVMLLTVALFLVGCHKLEAMTRIEPNGSGELRMAVGFSAEERANMEKQHSNPQDFCNISQMPANVTVTEEQRGDETWCITITRFKDLTNLRSLYEQRKGIRINHLEISDRKFYYDIEVDTLSEDSSFSALTDITWSVVLPGAIIEHNADQVDGNTLKWIPTPKSGIIHLHAESEVPQSGFNFPLCGTALIGLGIVFIHSRRRGRNSWLP